MNFFNGAVFNNNGTLDDHWDSTFTPADAAGGTFSNLGLFRKLDAELNNTATVFAVPLNNDGDVEIHKGIGEFRAGGTSDGRFAGELGTELIFAGLTDLGCRYNAISVSKERELRITLDVESA